jgi:hypothetical protein
MSSVPPAIPKRWRAGAGPISRRRRLVPPLLAALASVVVLLVLGLPYLRPPARCRLVPLCLNAHDDPLLHGPAWRGQDAAGLAEGGFFGAVSEPPARLTRAALEQELTSLARHRQNVVVYLAGLARLDAAGHIHLLPADADLDEPATWLPLARVLEALAGRSHRHLLLLDLEAPVDDPRTGVVRDDLAAALPAELEAVPDAHRLVLSARDAVQQSWASEVLGRSAFGHYVEEGLRGQADASGDGRVSARELARFVRSRVDRWARQARQARQTPVLFGEGDFILADLPGGTARPPRELPEEPDYPAWLAQAWKKAGDVPERRAALARAEQRWRDGADEERVHNAVNRALALPGRPRPPGPPPMSLALELGGEPARTEHVDALRALVFRVEAQTRSLPAPKAVDMRTQLVAEYLKGLKEPRVAELEWAALELASADARPETVRLLAALVAALEPRPSHVETLALRRLARLDLARPVLRRALEVVRDVETAGSRPRIFGLDVEGVAGADRLRHEGLVCLESPGYASQAQGAELLDRAAAALAAVLTRQRTALEAVAELDRAQRLLPDSLGYVERSDQGGASWLRSAELARRLSDIVAGAPGRGAPGEQFDELQRLARLLRGRLEELEGPFTPEARERLVTAARRDSATARDWRDLDALLATPLVSGADRPGLWKTARELDSRLQDELLRRDRQDGTRLDDVTPGEVDSSQPALDRARRAAALVALEELPAGPRKALEGALGALTQPRSPEEALARFELVLRQSWRAVPAVPPSDTRLWAFLADRFRYEAREAAALEDEPGTAFYSQAADRYRRWLAGPPEEYVELAETNEPPRLLPDRPIVKEVEVRPVTAEAKPAMRMTILTPDDGAWLKVRPERLALPGPGVRVRTRSLIVPLAVALAPTAGKGPTPRPSGLLVQVRLGRRAYHRRVGIPLSPRGPEILLSASEKAPTPALTELKLRPGVGRQGFHLFLRNPTDRVWNKLVVRLRYGGENRLSQPIRLAGGEVQPVTFPAAPVAVVATPPPAAPAAPPAAAVPPPLPLLEGPIRVTVEDQEDRDAGVASRALVADVARPEEYVELTQVRYDPGEARDRLEVRLRLRRTLAPPPVAVAFSFPAPLDGGVVPGMGTLRGKLPPTRDEVLLFSDKVQPPAGAPEGRFAVDVDGWARAFSFRATLAPRGGASSPRQLMAPAIRLAVGAYGVAGPAFKVPLEVDNAPPGSTIEVTLGRLVGGTFRVEAQARRPTARERLIGFTPSGPGGALVFDATWRDWTVEMDTSLIRGPRELRARLLDSAGRQLALAARPITLGDSAPGGVEFISPPKQAWRMAPVALRARAGDGVGIKAAFFFVGKPADNKPPAGAVLALGTPLDTARQIWGVKLPLPKTGSGPTDVSVQFVNQLGLSTFATTTIDLVETDPNLAKGGTIRGKVTEGDRDQVGLPVILTDDKGAEKGRTATKEGGAYEFTGLAPGKYRVSCVKTSRGSSGSVPKLVGTFIDLKAGETVTADITLYLRGG